MTQAIPRRGSRECNDKFSQFLKDRKEQGATFNELVQFAQSMRLNQSAVYEFFEARSDEIRRKKEYVPKAGDRPGVTGRIRYWNKEIWNNHLQKEA